MIEKEEELIRNVKKFEAACEKSTSLGKKFESFYKKNEVFYKKLEDLYKESESLDKMFENSKKRSEELEKGFQARQQKLEFLEKQASIMFGKNETSVQQGHTPGFWQTPLVKVNETQQSIEELTRDNAVEIN